jgi:hypothetical protein
VNRHLILAGLAAVLVAAGCSSMSVHSDYDHNVDFSKYRTWSWLPKKSESMDTGAGISPIVKRRIADAIGEELSAKGFQKASSPDFYVVFFAGVQQRQELRSSGPVYGPYGYGFGWGATDIYTYTYEEGSLVIDVVDAKKNEAVWRGTASGVVGRDSGDGQKVDEVVRKVLMSFPPGAK